MKHVRITNPSALDVLKKEFLVDTDFTSEQHTERLRALMMYEPRATWIAASFDEEQGNKLAGFCVAYAPQNLNYVFIDQVWCDVKYKEQHLPELYLARVKAWLLSLGRTKIRIDTSRDPRAYTRRWGFVQISATMELDLDQENNNGQVIRTEERLDPNGESEGLTESSHGTDRTGNNGPVQSGIPESPEQLPDREGSDSISRTDRAKSDPSIQSGDESDSGIQSEPTELPDATGSDTTIVRKAGVSSESKSAERVSSEHDNGSTAA